VSGLRLCAPAKVNWTLEVLHIRPDGYHELRSVLQTIDLVDTVTLHPADGIELALGGDAGHLRDEEPRSNLAWRAANALRLRCGVRAGVRIDLHKSIPIAAGLGGGSSDAAAVLRGCNALWGCRQDDANLMEIAGEIGSDTPFFIVGGTASVGGRGDNVQPLPDARAPAMMLATPPPQHRGDKTGRMYAALSPDDFSEGYVTIGLEDVVEAGREIDSAALNNVFERVLSRQQQETEKAMDALRAQGVAPRLAGSGPSFFVLLDAGRATHEAALEARIRELGFEPRRVRALARADALRIEEL
jgi:4-diphosphocytidyl-2-C-methyl-D-erythritol kinase